MISWGIVGCRHFCDYAEFCKHMDTVVEKHGMPDQVVSGGARGADSLAQRWAKEKDLSFVCFPPKEAEHPSFRAACLARNTQIVNASQLLVAFPSRQSKGTWDSIRKAENKQIPCIVIDV